MESFTGTVSLIEISGLYLAVSLADTLMIGQSSEISLSEDNDKSVGRFEYTDKQLPAFYLNDQLLANDDTLSLKQNQFCIGMKTSQESDYYVLLCKQFEQLEISELEHQVQELPAFMSDDRAVVERVFQHKGNVYLVTSPDKLLSYIVSNETRKNQKVKNA